MFAEYNILAAERFKSLAEKFESYLDEFYGIRILTVGRLTTQKGQDIIVIATIL